MSMAGWAAGGVEEDEAHRRYRGGTEEERWLWEAGELLVLCRCMALRVQSSRPAEILEGVAVFE